MVKSILKKVLLAGAIIIAAWLLIGSYFVFWGTYSKGYRIGTVIKLNKKGYVFKTYEGQLNLDFFPPGGKGNTQSNIWEFSVADKAVADNIEKANDRGKKVKLYFDERYYRLPWVGETKYVVTQVEEIGGN